METDEGAKRALLTNPYAPPAAEAQPRATTRPPLASLGKRFGGILIDQILAWAGGAFLSGVVAGATGVVRTRALIFACSSLVYALQWALVVVRGQSIGKILLKTRIVREDGALPGFVHGVVLRAWPLWLAQIGQLLLGQAGGVMSVIPMVDAVFILPGDERRCVHDLIAGTWVVDVSRDA